MQAVGPISNALEICRGQLADCASFLDFLGVTTREAAIAKTFLAALPPPANGVEYTPDELEASVRPFAMVATSPVEGYYLKAEGQWAWRDGGRILIQLQTNIPTAYQETPQSDPIDLTVDLESADRWANNKIGSLQYEFTRLSGRAGYLDVLSVHLRGGPSRERHEEPIATGYYYWAMLDVEWGTKE